MQFVVCHMDKHKQGVDVPLLLVALIPLRFK